MSWHLLGLAAICAMMRDAASQRWTGGLPGNGVPESQGSDGNGQGLLDRACRCERHRCLQKYIEANAVAFARLRRPVFGAPQHTIMLCPEGRTRSRNVVIEFPSYEAATACYASPEYGAAMRLRQHVPEGDLVIIEGYDGPQPGGAA